MCGEGRHVWQRGAHGGGARMAKWGVHGEGDYEW